MTTLTPTEAKVLLTLFKDFNHNYNANSLSKEINISPRGALKILKNLAAKDLLIKKRFGKAVFYKVNLEDYYSSRIIETLLISEAREKSSRWLSEFQELFKEVDIAIIFGSAIRQFQEANDIDLLLVFSEKNIKLIRQFIHEKNKILLKPIHPIIQSPLDFKNNLNKSDSVILNSLKQGYVLYGYEKLIEAVKHVTSF